MTTGSILVKVLVMYISINLVLFAGGVHISSISGGSTLFSDLVSTNSTGLADDQAQYGLGTIQTQVPNVNEQTNIVSSGFSFIDVLRSVRGFINFVLVMLFGIFIVFLVYPPVIQLFVGVPMALLFLVALIYFTRSGQ